MTSVRVGAPQPGDVYVGRAGRGEDGTFGNPHPVGFCSTCGGHIHDRKGALDAYAYYLDERLKSDRTFWLLVMRLRGKTLWCPGNCTKKGLACHAEILAKRIDEERGDQHGHAS